MNVDLLRPDDRADPDRALGAGRRCFADVGLAHRSACSASSSARSSRLDPQLVIRRVVNRIVNGAKSKANVDDTQALDARRSRRCASCSARGRSARSCRTSSTSPIVIVALLLIVNVLAPNALALAHAAHRGDRRRSGLRRAEHRQGRPQRHLHRRRGSGRHRRCRRPRARDRHRRVRQRARDARARRQRTLWYVRNGEITRIGNMSQGWSRVIIDLAVPDGRRHRRGRGGDARHDEGARQGREVAHPHHRASPRSGAWSRCQATRWSSVSSMKTRANAKDDVARELRMRLKQSIDELGSDAAAAELDHTHGPRGRAARSRRQPAEDEATAIRSRPSARRSDRRGGRSASAEDTPA